MLLATEASWLWISWLVTAPVAVAGPPPADVLATPARVPLAELDAWDWAEWTWT